MAQAACTLPPMLPHKLQFVLRRAVVRVQLQGLAVILFRRLPLPAFHRPIAQAAQCRALVKSSLRWVGQRFGGFLQTLECAFGGGKILHRIGHLTALGQKLRLIRRHR